MIERKKKIYCCSRLVTASPAVMLFFSLVFSLTFAVNVIAGGKTVDAVNFTSQIRPLLAAKCYHCHGPDESSRKAKLRLDLRDEVTKERKNGIFPIKAGDSKNSELLRRISSKDAD
jgi:hypothetical protein